MQQLGRYFPPLPCDNVLEQIKHKNPILQSRKMDGILMSTYCFVKLTQICILSCDFYNQNHSKGIILTDVHESNAEYILYCDLPGILSEDISIFIDGNQSSDDLNFLNISTTRELNYNGISHIIERVSGDFRRRIAIPRNADISNVDITFNNGVLTVVFQKSNDTESVVKKILLIK